MAADDTSVAPVASAQCRPDRPGDLSIVVQGGLSGDNLFETANAVRHWRTLFPAAQLLFALSGTSILETPDADGDLRDPRLAPPFARDSQMCAALAGIRRDCDVMVLAEGAFPLPPIKADTAQPNNINLQIAAARAGLARAAGCFVLRVRSDLVFLDRGFLDQYAVHADAPRGDASILRRRVLISWIYTLNPFAEERLPLHFSDWFHFGLREDVTRLWDVPSMTLADAVFYRAHPHAPHSNAAERLFNMRLADEQHVAAHALGRDDEGLRVRFHNDPDAAVRAVRALADNFVPCDMKAANCVFPKHGEEFDNHRKWTACITPEDWRALVAARNVDPRIVLSDKIGQVRDPGHHALRQGFPRRFVASQFATETGLRSHGAIIARGDGVVARGPKMPLPPGRYVARLSTGLIEGPGVLHMSVTTGNGGTLVAERAFGAGTAPGEASIAFEIVGFAVEDVEILCRADRVDAVTVDGLSLDQADPQAADRRFPRFVPLLPDDRSDRLAAASSAGRGRRTSGMALRPGRYVAAVDLPARTAASALVLTATIDGGARTIASRRVDGRDEASARCELPFDIVDIGVEDWMLSCEGDVDASAAICVVVAQRGWSDVAEPSRFYDAPSLRVAEGLARVDHIASNGRSGLLCFGPYADLPAGRYTATVHAGGDRPAYLAVTVTAQFGRRRLATAGFARRQPEGAIAVPFEIGADGETHVEVVCRVRRPGRMIVTGVTLARIGPPPQS